MLGYSVAPRLSLGAPTSGEFCSRIARTRKLLEADIAFVFLLFALTLVVDFRRSCIRAWGTED